MSLLVAGATPLAVAAAVVVVSHGFGGGGVDMFLSFPFKILPKNVGGDRYTRNKRERERKKERKKQGAGDKDKTLCRRYAKTFLSLSPFPLPSSSSSSSLFFAEATCFQNWRLRERERCCDLRELTKP